MTPAIAQSPHRWGWGLPIWSLYAREVLRFVRQRNRVIGSLGTPLLFWIMLGSGFGESLRAPGADLSGHDTGLGYVFSNRATQIRGDFMKHEVTP